MKAHNFSAGPSILPQEVIQQTSEAVLNFEDSGLSILEISHRSSGFVGVIEEARQLVLKLMNLEGKGYSALFLHGGASLQFVMIPYNLMKVGGKAAYLDTGTWAANAIQEALEFGKTNVVASSRQDNYNFIPKNFDIPSDADYLHCTSNNTIYGTQMQFFPELEIPMVCDMSSDIFSKSMDFSKFDLIYASAQKNLGPAGTTLVVVKDEILGKTGRNIPKILDYEVQISKESMYNTPSVYAIYTSLLTLRWLDKKGGVAAIEKINEEKAELLYREIDRNTLFSGTAEKVDRSKMNATFVLVDESKSAEFERICNVANISGLKGHRTVGGYRASMYNAMPIASVQVLVECMQKLEQDL